MGFFSTAKSVGRLAWDILLLPFKVAVSGGGALIYFPRSYSDIPEYAEWMESVERVDFESRGRGQTAFLDVAPGALPDRLWLFFGGNGALALDWLPVTSFADESSDGFVFVEYPGYGLSKGKPSPASIRDAIDDLVAAICKKYELSEADFSSRLGVVGHSLGAAVAMDTAARFCAERVILISPFTTMKALAVKTVGSFLARFLRHHFDNISSIELWQAQCQGDAKVVIFHGTKDELIPFSMAQDLAGRFQNCVDFRPVPDGDHNGIVLELRDEILELVVAAPTQ